MGLLHYREHVNLLTGWVHHSVYTALLLYIIHLDICHIFALAAFMELPTFVSPSPPFAPTCISRST